MSLRTNHKVIHRALETHTEVVPGLKDASRGMKGSNPSPDHYVQAACRCRKASCQQGKTGILLSSEKEALTGGPNRGAVGEGVRKASGRYLLS